eukprot:TRINITY_DN559_c0_g2_i1.p1 TRINITY_DN559_c0_g2~~TRINITY_DN559_c0_g2_i1.p1  ORF type:complete len:229 (-),score=-26.09 TRINITY_DN559_c0_g2_i1:204-890(-)
MKAYLCQQLSQIFLFILFQTKLPKSTQALDQNQKKPRNQDYFDSIFFIIIIITIYVYILYNIIKYCLTYIRLRHWLVGWLQIDQLNAYQLIYIYQLHNKVLTFCSSACSFAFYYQNNMLAHACYIASKVLLVCLYVFQLQQNTYIHIRLRHICANFSSCKSQSKTNFSLLLTLQLKLYSRIQCVLYLQCIDKNCQHDCWSQSSTLFTTIFQRFITSTKIERASALNRK